MRFAALFIVMPALLAGCGSSNEAPSAASTVTAGASSQAAPAVGDEVPPRLRSVIARTLKIDDSRVTPRAAFTTDLGADELSMVELVMAYEREFKVRISDADADRFARVEDVMRYLRQHQ